MRHNWDQLTKGGSYNPGGGSTENVPRPNIGQVPYGSEQIPNIKVAKDAVLTSFS